MKKIIFAGTILLASSNLAAHSNVCDYSVDYNIQITDEQIVFNKKGEREIIFFGDKLSINGKYVSLNNEQRAANRAFQQETRQILPKVAEIAVEGAEIGVKAATLVATSFFGNDEDVHTDLIKPIESLSQKIKENINTHSLNTDQLEQSFDGEFEKEIEGLVEKAISKYSGRIISQIIGSVFSSDNEELKDFEFRMENLESDIEAYIETQASALEIKAESLCEDFARLADYDAKLEQVVGYPSKGIIYKGSQQGLQISGLNLN